MSKELKILKTKSIIGKLKLDAHSYKMQSGTEQCYNDSDLDQRFKDLDIILEKMDLCIIDVQLKEVQK